MSLKLMREIVKKYDHFIVILWAAILFIPFLGAVHLFDWDEINFAESAREMLVSDNFQQVQINFQPFYEKPPFFFWLQAISMTVFGVNEFAARFPNAVCGIITLVFVFNIAKKLFGQRIAFLWVLMISGSFTPHLYFKSGIIDPFFNLFIFISIYQLYKIKIADEAGKKIIPSTLLGFFIGMATITKGPVALLILFLVLIVILLINKFKIFFKFSHFIIAFIACFFTCSLWFGMEVLENGPQFLLEFIKYQIELFLLPVADHGQPFWYHAVVLLIGCFPASIFALQSLFKRELSQDISKKFFIQTMQVLFWVVLILFSIVKTKIVHYSSLCYLPLTFLAAYNVNSFITENKKINVWQSLLLIIIGLTLGFAFTLITFTDKLKPFFIDYIKDPFAVACLSINANWNEFEFVLGLIFLTVVITSFVNIIKGKNAKAIFSILVFISIFIPLFTKMVVPRIEEYSQATAIEFYVKHQDEDCYIETLNFKSYAQYFYAKCRQHQNSNYRDKNWLLSGDIDKTAYFVFQNNNKERILPQSVTPIYKKGGFEFYKREKQNNSGSSY